MLKRIKADFEHVDERGTITQLIHSEYKQINVITSKKGVFRGGHYHKKNGEAFYIISGSLRVRVNDDEYSFHAGDFFGIEPGDMHSFQFEEDTVLVSMYSDCVVNPDGTMDMYAE